MKTNLYRVLCLTLIGAGTLFAQPSFTKVTEGPVVTDLGVSPVGPAWGDLNNDGYPDLVIIDEGRFVSTNDFTRAVPMVYLNNQDGTFRRAAQADIGPLASTEVLQTPMRLTDYDNDGYLDVYMYEGIEHDPEKVAFLYRGGPDGRFKLVGEDVGINRPLGPWLPSAGTYPYPWGVSWVDYDQDGFLDSYLTTAAVDSDTVDQLWRNKGNGTFSQVLTNVFRPGFRSIFGCWADYDNDGDPDIFIGANPGTGRFYRNDRHGQFTDMTTSLGLNYGWYGAWGDYDNDGRLDLHTERDLFWNDGTGGFAIRTESASPGAGAMNCIDYDNDGFLDYFTVQSPYPRRLMRSNRDGTFEQVSLGDLTDDSPTTGVAAWADYDNDGFLDVVVAKRASWNFNDMYHNDGNGNHWLLVKLVGTASNRSAIGAKVRAQATIWGKTVQQMREISGTPFAGDPRAHFGLGDATQVELLRIEWPSGIVQTVTNVSPNQILTVTEHQAGMTNAPSLTVSKPAAGPVQLTAAGQTNLRYVFEASSDLAQWTKLAVRTNLTSTVDFTPPASSVPQQFYRVVMP